MTRSDNKAALKLHRKRPRDNSDEKELIVTADSRANGVFTSPTIDKPSPKNSTLKPTYEDFSEDLPPYGSQEYWEQRYEKLKNDCCNEKTSNDQNSSCTDNPPDPFHAWYFNFEELAPLILPLILGDGDREDEDEEETSSTAEDSKIVQIETTHEDLNGRKFSNVDEKAQLNHNVTNPDGKTDLEEVDGDDDDDGDDYYDDVEEEEHETNDPSNYKGLAHNGPISVMEVGCGDVPLGRDLLSSILEMEAEAKIDPSNILEKVICLDYSKNVIDAMKAEQHRTVRDSEKGKEKSTVPLEYHVADARDLPHDDKSFDLVLEKGTLDAMLSDRDGNGPTNCRKIVSECARVTKEGGCIVIISHLNANCQPGLEWLDDIVVPGLRMGAPKFEWSVEVHGSEADVLPSDDEQDDEDNTDELPESPGPAVYIIRKGGMWTTKESVDVDNEELPTVPLRFFSY
ncbi:methyltransferase domain containing protein [Nitzschia inconspicua]|uniref:Methyltransferase domain containing protein n=1 Tax=Nitzschia inconspicua TaxID=303405 RepID=A0A9K3LG42_9STRA|nr:methyltransferase domain containing protein [Nitzschia inconspicua]